jgi:hypothetical protein
MSSLKEIALSVLLSYVSIFSKPEYSNFLVTFIQYVLGLSLQEEIKIAFYVRSYFCYVVYKIPLFLTFSRLVSQIYLKYFHNKTFFMCVHYANYFCFLSIRKIVYEPDLHSRYYNCPRLDM